ncbi:Divalent cation transporter [Sulfurimonas denitrificans DSM 1251]|uniref:Magnesium transporter MgtE n=1 Tax=Sulfurimonas denitrificans (strain ATCC 33889 / DSM 1251) TaxID=326298 RepID=Q30QW1_SULDN|nr:magnesium transporter [Sulfurimonas denitrificans]ABB44620.1 Divalent cation transporter [Sulfurimonas denitrificans DSM 1251]MDD3443455.1 magnesium transporter [Sulfurimonas denitrificans]
MDYFKTKLHELLLKREWNTLRHLLARNDSFELANLIEEIDDESEIIVIRLLSRAQTKEVFCLLSYEKQLQIIKKLAQSSHKLSILLNDMEPDDRTAFFEELPEEITQKLIKTLSSKEQAITIQLLEYPEDSIGRLMTPEYVAVKSEHTVEEAFAHIRKYGRDSETLNVIYVVDDERKLIDDIRIKELILALPTQRVEELLDYRFIALNAMDDQEKAISTFQDYDRVALPVLNSDGVLVGIVSIDDIMDVVEEESTEDFHKFGSFSEAISNPLKEKVFNLYKKRILWLVALVFMNIFSGEALSNFETLIQSMVSLVFFLPLLIDSGGNAGSQSATLMIRSLAIGDVKINDWYKLIAKEVGVALLLGLTMALAVGLVASFRAPEIALVVSMTMVIVVLNGSLIGMLLPFLFTKLKLDPATASAPLVTSIADISGVIIYFSIASWYFGIV